MIGKLIVHGQNRLDAIYKLKQAIVEFEIEGIETTLDFGLYVLEHDEFILGRMDTGFIDTYYSEFVNSANTAGSNEAAALVAFSLYIKNRDKISRILPQSSHWYHNRKQFN
jgi:acetyl/propionyl-CoA carboxylase alpha subunit